MGFKSRAGRVWVILVDRIVPLIVGSTVLFSVLVWADIPELGPDWEGLVKHDGFVTGVVAALYMTMVLAFRYRAIARPPLLRAQARFNALETDVAFLDPDGVAFIEASRLLGEAGATSRSTSRRCREVVHVPRRRGKPRPRR